MATNSIPNAGSPLVDMTSGKITYPWFRFFTSLISGPQAAISQVVGISPASFTAPRNGMFVVSGGAITGASFARGGNSWSISAPNVISMRLGDKLTLTYTLGPTVAFLAD